MSKNKKKPAQVWGRRSAAFYADLEGETVTVAVVTGKCFRGTLVGVDTYDLIIRQGSGLELLLPKGNVVYVHAAST
jgi:hypothetical protein